MRLLSAKKRHTAGISASVLDLKSLGPLDEAAILDAAEKTGRVIIVEETRDRCSAAKALVEEGR